MNEFKQELFDAAGIGGAAWGPRGQRRHYFRVHGGAVHRGLPREGGVVPRRSSAGVRALPRVDGGHRTRDDASLEN